MPRGCTPDFKWQGWSNGGNNQKPKKSLRLQTKPPKNSWTKIQPPKPLTCIVTEKPQQGGVNKLLYCIASHAEFPSHKNFQKAFNDITQKTETLVLNTQKKSLHKSSYPKKYLPKFSYPKKSRDQKFQTQKNPLIIPVTWNLEYLPPTPLGMHVKSYPGPHSQTSLAS